MTDSQVKKSSFYFLIIIAALFATGLSAAEILSLSDSYFSTDYQVTTPSKRQQMTGKTPADIIVITAADIKAFGARTLADIFRQYAVFNVRETDYASWDTGLRGLSDNRHYAILIDGIPFYGKDWNPVWLQALPVTLQDVERIEILKGSQTVYYSDSAISGVINIITYSAQDQSGGDFTLTLGNKSFSDAALSMYGGISETALSLSLAHKSSDRWAQNSDAGETFLIISKAEYNIDSETSLEFDLKFSRSDENDLNQLIRNTFDIKDYNLSASLKGDNYNSYISFLKRTVSGNPLLIPGYVPYLSATELEENIINFEYFKYFEFLGGVASYGINYDVYDSKVDVDGYPSSDNDSDIFSFFFDEQASVSDLLDLKAGVKYKRHSDLSGLFDWDLGMTYKSFDDVLVKVRFASASRLPSNEELLSFSPDFTRGSFFWILGNEEIDEERVYSGELSIDFYLISNLKVKASVYYQDIKSLIERTSQPVPSEQNAFTSMNALSMDVFGIELSMVYFYSSGKIYMDFAHTSTERDDWGGRDTIPAEKMNLSILHNFQNGLSFYSALHFISDYDVVEGMAAYVPTGFYPIDSFMTLDMALNLVWNDNIDISLAAVNILDEQHEEDYLGEEIGRRITLSATFAF